jgi:ATP-dependent Lhr-like helicase
VSLNRLIDLFEGTVIAKEAYRELFTDYMDIKGAMKVLESIHHADTKVETGLLSVFGREGLFSSRDTIPPPIVDQAVIGTLKRRLDQEQIVLCCMNCHGWKIKNFD